MTTQAEQTESATKEADALVEAQHGPCVFISHPDGSRFAFRRLERAQFEVRNGRVERGGDDAVNADERMLQERCVETQRPDWNKYVAASAFETFAYADVYRQAHGDVKVRKCDAGDELPGDKPDTVAVWLTNGQIVVGFRKPGRAEVKMFQAHMVARQRGEKMAKDPVETILRNCAHGTEFAAWLEENLFGLGRFADAFLDSFGMNEARVSGK